jgi:hypothetical protein
VDLLDGEFSPDEVLMHPRHQAVQQLLPDLITQLRACRNVEDGYEFQQELLARVLEAESDRNAFSTVIKRMRRGKQPQPGAPEPQSGLDPARRETWQLEYVVCERVARQYRCVGDALAWRVFGFQRQHIIALCQNESPGVMAGKAGLAAERDRVERAYRDDGQFAILHDLTNCLRIGDITVFGNDGSMETLEIKSASGRRSSGGSRLPETQYGAVARCPTMTEAPASTILTSRSRHTWTCCGPVLNAPPRRESSPRKSEAEGRCLSPTSTVATRRAGPMTSTWTG